MFSYRAVYKDDSTFEYMAKDNVDAMFHAVIRNKNLKMLKKEIFNNKYADIWLCD